MKYRVAVLSSIVAMFAGMLVSAGAQPAGAVAAEPGTFVAVGPSRVLDTRTSGPVGPGVAVPVQVLGNGSIPAAGVSAVVLNVTVVAPASGGFVTAYPHGAARPTTSNLNFVRGQTVANLVVVPVGTEGKVDLYDGSAGTVQLLADVSGYYVAGAPVVAGTFHSLAPTRVLDTRVGPTGQVHPVAARSTLRLALTPQNGVPADAAAVVLNVTAVNGAAPGYLTVFPAGAPRPTVSNVNFGALRAVPNLVFAALGPNAVLQIYNGASRAVDVVADLEGYYLAGAPLAAGTFVPRFPFRTLDTRVAGGTAVLPHQSYALQMAAATGVSAAGMAAAALNVTVTQPTAGGYVTAYPKEQARPTASIVNFAAGQTVASLAVIPLGTGGVIELYNGSSGTIHLIADESGFFTDGTLGAITGRATNSAGHGVSGVRVTLGQGSFPEWDDNVTVTGADGSYAVAGLGPADYSVCFGAHAGTGPTDVADGAPYGYTNQCFNGAGPNAADPVSVTTAHVTAGVDAHLLAAGAISGTVTDTSSHRLGGVQVSIAFPNGVDDAVATTAADGSYTLRGLDSTPFNNSYGICGDDRGGVTGGTSAAGYLHGCANSSPLIDPGVRVTGIDFEMPAAAGIRGVVTDAAGHPLRGVPVHTTQGFLFNSSPNAVTDSLGVYKVIGLDPGAYNVCFQGTQAVGDASPTGYIDRCYRHVAVTGPNVPAGLTPVTSSAGQVTDNVDEILPVAAAVSGSVTDLSGKPFPNVAVSVYDQDQDGLTVSGSATTDGSGRYRINSLRAGIVMVCFFVTPGNPVPPPSGYLNQCYRGADPLRATANVSLRSGLVTPNIDAHLNHGGTITGRVTDGSLHPVSGVIVHSDRLSATSQLDGTYSLTWVQPGLHPVCFDASEATGGSSAIGYINQCYHNAPYGSPDLTVSVTAGLTTSGIDAALASAGAIGGIVTDPSGHPLGGVQVSIFDESDPNSGSTGTATDSTGSFIIPKLTPGGYTVCFTASATPVTGGTSSGGYADECYGQPASPQRTVITVTSGATTHIVQALPALGSIGGKVTNAAGDPLSDINVTVIDAAGTVQDFWTPANGTYRADRLPAGTYTVCFSGFWAHPQSGGQCWDHLSGGTRTPVVVAAGAGVTGIDATLNPVPPGATRPANIPAPSRGPTRGGRVR